MNGSRIAILGVSYKAGTGDTRESLALRIMEVLKQRGAVLSYHDPHVRRFRTLNWQAFRSPNVLQKLKRSFSLPLTGHRPSRDRGASLQHAARLAGLDSDAAANAADGLAAVHMLCPGQPLSFVHPLIRSAVGASMSPLARGQAHHRAAGILRENNSMPEAVAAHLLCAPPAADPDAVNTLRSVARKALATGSAEGAARLLERALAEPPPPDLRGEILAELAQAEALAGLPQGTEQLAEAIRLTKSQGRRAELALAQGRALYARASYRQAAEVLDWAMTELQIDDVTLTAALDAAYVSAASRVPELAHDAPARRDRMLLVLADPPTSGQRTAVAHIAVLDGMLGQPRSAVRKLADVAWGDGALLADETVDGLGWPLLTSALLLTDELEQAIEICDVALSDARIRESPLALATVSRCRAGRFMSRDGSLKQP